MLYYNTDPCFSKHITRSCSILLETHHVLWRCEWNDSAFGLHQARGFFPYDISRCPNRSILAAVSTCGWVLSYIIKIICLNDDPCTDFSLGVDRGFYDRARRLQWIVSVYLVNLVVYSHRLRWVVFTFLLMWHVKITFGTCNAMLRHSIVRCFFFCVCWYLVYVASFNQTWLLIFSQEPS